MATSVLVHLISVQHGQRFPRQCQDARTLRGRKKESAVRRSRGRQGKGPFVWDTWVSFFWGDPFLWVSQETKRNTVSPFCGDHMCYVSSESQLRSKPWKRPAVFCAWWWVRTF